MTATGKTASNGTKPPASMPDRSHGVARVQEAQAYHLATVAHDAAYEAERLCSDIYRAASETRFGDTPGSTIEALADPDMIRKAEEAVTCLATAVLYLTDLYHGTLPH